MHHRRHSEFSLKTQRLVWALSSVVVFFFLIILALFVYFESVSYFERLDCQWSGWLLKASFSVSTPYRVTSGPMESCCGRSSLLVTVATPNMTRFHNLDLVPDDFTWKSAWKHRLSLSLCSSSQVRVHTPTLLWIPTSTRWSKMDTTWISRTFLQMKCEQKHVYVAVNKGFLEMILTCALRYQLMRLCWSLEPTHRPTFKTIGQLISRFLPSTNDILSHHNDQVKKQFLSSVLSDKLQLYHAVIVFSSDDLQKHWWENRRRKWRDPRWNVQKKRRRLELVSTLSIYKWKSSLGTTQVLNETFIFFST